MLDLHVPVRWRLSLLVLPGAKQALGKAGGRGREMEDTVMPIKEEFLQGMRVGKNTSHCRDSKQFHLEKKKAPERQQQPSPAGHFCSSQRVPSTPTQQPQPAVAKLLTSRSIWVWFSLRPKKKNCKYIVEGESRTPSPYFF